MPSSTFTLLPLALGLLLVLLVVAHPTSSAPTATAAAGGRAGDSDEIGRVAWSMAVDGSVEGSPTPAVCPSTGGKLTMTGSNESYNCLLFGTYSGEAYAITPATGKKVWKKPFVIPEMIRSTFTTFHGAGFFVDGNSVLYSVSLATGTQNWAFPTAAPAESFGCSSPVVYPLPGREQVEGVVIFGSVDGRVYGVNTTSGEVSWRYITNNFVYGSPILSRGSVFIGSDDGSMYALNAQNGSLLWQYTVWYPIRSSSALWNDRVLFFGANNGILYALDTVNGSLLFQFATGAPITGAPALGTLDGGASPVVFVGSYDNSMYALNGTSGQKLWSFATKDNVIGSAAVYPPMSPSSESATLPSSSAVNNTASIYFGSVDTYIYALNAATGQLLWHFNVAQPVWSKPFIVDTGAEQIAVFGTEAPQGGKGEANDGATVWALKL